MSTLAPPTFAPPTLPPALPPPRPPADPLRPTGQPQSTAPIGRSAASRWVRRAGPRRWGARLLVAALIAGALALDLSPIAAVALLFVLVVPFEKLFPRHPGQRVRRPLLGTDIAHALVSPLLAVAGVVVAVVVGVASLAWIPGLLVRPLVATIPPAALPFVGIALFDLATYWVHRWSHEVPFLWRFHSVHHSTEHMDWVSGFRNHPFDGAIVAPPFVLLIAAGFDATFTGVLAAVQLVTGLFLHANVRWRWRPLHRIVITPEFHHWHHADEQDAHNSNYSVFLPLWDTVFGTYFMPRDRRPQRYGISEPMPSTLLGQLHHPVRGVGNPATHAWRSLRHPLRTVRAAYSFGWAIARDVWRSTTRTVRQPTPHASSLPRP